MINEIQFKDVSAKKIKPDTSLFLDVMANFESDFREEFRCLLSGIDCATWFSERVIYFDVSTGCIGYTDEWEEEENEEKLKLTEVNSDFDFWAISCIDDEYPEEMAEEILGYGASDEERKELVEKLDDTCGYYDIVEEYVDPDNLAKDYMYNNEIICSYMLEECMNKVIDFYCENLKVSDKRVLVETERIMNLMQNGEIKCGKEKSLSFKIQILDKKFYSEFVLCLYKKIKNSRVSELFYGYSFRQPICFRSSLIFINFLYENKYDGKNVLYDMVLDCILGVVGDSTRHKKVEYVMMGDFEEAVLLKEYEYVHTSK